jgi:hypothetical protein
MLALVCHTTWDALHPIMPSIIEHNDGMKEGDLVFYKIAGPKQDWTQWSSRQAVLTSTQDPERYKIDTSCQYDSDVLRYVSKNERHVFRAARNLKRRRIFPDTIAIPIESSTETQHTIKCPGCYCRHRHGLGLGDRVPHCTLRNIKGPEPFHRQYSIVPR